MRGTRSKDAQVGLSKVGGVEQNDAGKGGSRNQNHGGYRNRLSPVRNKGTAGLAVVFVLIGVWLAIIVVTHQHRLKLLEMRIDNIEAAGMEAKK